jgi:hypothetical protein
MISITPDGVLVVRDGRTFNFDNISMARDALDHWDNVPAMAASPRQAISPVPPEPLDRRGSPNCSSPVERSATGFQG